MKFSSIFSSMILLSLFSCQMSPSSSDASGSADSLAVSRTESKGKVQHMVCFKFKDGISETLRQQHMDDFAALKDSIPEIVGYSGGYTFEVDYEKTADYDCMHIASFNSEEDLEKYFYHPAHQRFIERNKESWANVIVVNSKE